MKEDSFATVCVEVGALRAYLVDATLGSLLVTTAIEVLLLGLMVVCNDGLDVDQCE